MWDEVADVLKKNFTVVRYDHRNHGASEIVLQDFSIDEMADDAAELIKGLGDQPVAFIGLSLGGMVAQSLAARYPALLNACVIANSAGYYDDSVKKMWADRIARVSKEGVSSISNMAIERWFTSEYLQSGNAVSKAKIADIKFELDAFDSVAYALSCAAVAQVNCLESNNKINIPTLILFGTKDQATPPELSKLIHQSIASSELAEINAAHLSAVEKPEEFAEIVSKFLRAH
jgi:3-oxoadipate enol-lactonase